MAMDAGRISGTLFGLALIVALVPGCGRDVPIEFNRAVSPCIEMPKLMGFDGADALQTMLAADLKQKDADGDGFVTLKEALANTAKPNLIDASLFNAINPKDGKMSKADLAKGGATLFKWATYYKVKLLNRFDKNGDHFLTLDEIKGYFNIDEAAFKEADKPAPADSDNKADIAKSPISDSILPGNGDKQLDPDEFLGLVLHQNSIGCGAADSTAPTTAAAANVRRPMPVPVRR